MGDRPEGAKGFDDTFWRTNYADPSAMDGVTNASSHAAYLKGSFGVVLAEVRSVADFGFGMGHMFEAVLEAFQPFKALGIEPSPSVYEAVRFRNLDRHATRLVLENTDLASWCRRPDHPRLRFDLGVCTGVLQYLTEAELDLVVPVLSQRLKWLYLNVPTDEEFDRMAADTGFEDPWAIRRPLAYYTDLLRPHFDRVGTRLLESRVNVDERESPFTDLLFRGW